MLWGLGGEVDATDCRNCNLLMGHPVVETGPVLPFFGAERGAYGVESMSDDDPTNG